MSRLRLTEAALDRRIADKAEARPFAALLMDKGSIDPPVHPLRERSPRIAARRVYSALLRRLALLLDHPTEGGRHAR